MCAAAKRLSQSLRRWTLPALVILGLLIAAWSPVETDTLLRWGQQVGTNPWVWIAVGTAMALFFTFGLPGSLGLWLIAPFNPPWLSTILLVIASTIGAIGGYKFSVAMAGADDHKKEPNKLVQILQRRSDLLTLTALRMLPGFPHSAINFASGLTHVPRMRFIVATILGLSVKWGVYASAIYGIRDAAEAGDALGLTTVLPLLILVILTLIGVWFKSKHVTKPHHHISPS